MFNNIVVGTCCLYFICLTILLLELVASTVLVSNKNEDIFVELHDNLC